MTSSSMMALLLLLMTTSVESALNQGPVPAQLLRASPPSIQYNADCVVDQLYGGPSCDTFFMCMNGRTSNHQLVMFSCGRGTMFDSNRSVCVRAQPSRCSNGPDRITEETENSYTPRPPTGGTSSPSITTSKDTSSISLSSTSSPSTPITTASNSSPSTPIPTSSISTPSPSTPSPPNPITTQNTPSPPSPTTRPSTSSLPSPTTTQSTPSPPSPTTRPSTQNPPGPTITQRPPGPTITQSTTGLPSPTTRPSTLSPPRSTTTERTPSSPNPPTRPSTPSTPSPSTTQRIPSPPSPTNRPSPPSPTNRPISPSPPSPPARPSPTSPSQPARPPFEQGSRPPAPPGFKPPKPSPPTRPTTPSKLTKPSKPSGPPTTLKPKRRPRPGGFLASIFKPLISISPFGLDDPEPQGSPTCPQYSLDPTSLINCTREGRWEHPGDCSRFYQCIHTMDCILKGFIFRCPDNFHFVKSRGRCEALLRPTPCHKFSDASTGSFTYPVIQLEEESIQQFQQASAYWHYMPFLSEQS